MISEAALKLLEEIVDTTILEHPLPYKKGNSIRVKDVVVRKNSQGYLLYDIKKNRLVAKTHFKSSALAIAKCLSEGTDVTKEITMLDDQLLKHYNDSFFYIRTIKTTKEAVKREIRKARLGVSLDKTRIIRQQIDDFIF